jgi:uncharacterized protein (DUF1684 family)
MKHLYPALVIVFAVFGLPPTGLVAQSGTAYTKEIEQWHEKRVEGLKAPNGWLNLVGLYWLEEGRSPFGSSPDNKIVFPAGAIAGTAGYFERKGTSIKLVVADHVEITIDGKPVKEVVIFDKDSLRPPVLACGSLRWTIIQRDDKIGIRLRDLNSPLVTSFKGIDRYPVDTAWRITAVFKPALVPGTIAITNIIGQTNDQRSPGKLVFTIHNTSYTLDALEEGNELFIVFADGTNGKTTYPSGRFLAVEKPSAPDNTTMIDFNKAYNPPCAFTNYATCPLPPRQNVLPVDVEAGEKNFGHHLTPR